ncbi:hypothetical protein [Tomitella cavernea]|uniref:Uncharacterized protein n=1 Tax=Tomitella cavernea TaxID=1387982 RepID=A0ABP9D2V9_9ACTN|nr:hypothetical protein [Tomitella cavernea]
MASTAERAGARARARERMTEHLAARREREKKLQNALAAFFRTDDKLATARARRDAAYARADERYTRDTAATTGKRSALIVTMRELGQSVADIAELTGLSQADVRELHRAAGTDSGHAVDTSTETATDAAPSGGTRQSDAHDAGTAPAASTQPDDDSGTGGQSGESATA